MCITLKSRKLEEFLYELSVATGVVAARNWPSERSLDRGIRLKQHTTGLASPGCTLRLTRKGPATVLWLRAITAKEDLPLSARSLRYRPGPVDLRQRGKTREKHQQTTFELATSPLPAFVDSHSSVNPQQQRSRALRHRNGSSVAHTEQQQRHLKQRYVPIISHPHTHTQTHSQ